MDSSSSSSSSSFSNGGPSYWNYFLLLIVRPVSAISFVLVFIAIWWFLAWKLVLVHVPLVQEIFGLRKKAVKPKPKTGRFSKYYNRIQPRNSSPGINSSSSQ